jgi:hypothetical protein
MRGKDQMMQWYLLPITPYPLILIPDLFSMGRRIEYTAVQDDRGAHCAPRPDEYL